jgi:hypothetical protein
MYIVNPVGAGLAKLRNVADAAGVLKKVVLDRQA